MITNYFKLELKSEELKARLKKLQDIAERKAYQDLVKDITPPKDVQEPFSSYKDQLGFGNFFFTLHIRNPYSRFGLLICSVSFNTLC